MANALIWLEERKGAQDNVHAAEPESFPYRCGKCVQPLRKCLDSWTVVTQMDLTQCLPKVVAVAGNLQISCLAQVEDSKVIPQVLCSQG